MISVWTDERLARAREVLAQCSPVNLRPALDRLSEDFGFPVTYDALGNAFRKRGLGPLSSFCLGGGPRFVRAEAAAPEPSWRELVPSSVTCAAAPAPCAPKPEPATSSTTERVLFVPDAHHPYADTRAWALMLKAAQAWKPDHVVVLGDLIDFYSVSFHPKDPTRKVNLEREIEAGSEALRDLEGLGAKRRTYVMGNHEHRLQRYLMQHAPAIYGMVKLEEILKLAERGWVHVPYMDHVKVGSAYVSHEYGQHGMNAHRAARQTMNADTVIGHTHRMASQYQGHADGSTTVGHMFGHLIDLSTIDYMHRGQAMAWQLGFGVGHITSDGTTHMHGVPIIGYRCVVDGVVYEA